MFNIPIMTMAVMGLVAPSYAALAVPYNGDHSVYRCLTIERFESFNPSCIRQCEDMALKSGADGCQKDDFVCHCQNTQRIAQMVRPCFTSGPHATCSSEELRQLEENVEPMCSYMNQTGYAAYSSCPGILAHFADNGAEGAAQYLPQGYEA